MAVDEEFRRWWAEDYSWEGLAKKSWRGGPEGATLQDYWKDEAGALESFAGRQWTRFHLPLRDPSGKRSPKAAWDETKVRHFHSDLVDRATAKEETRAWPTPLDGIVTAGHIDFADDNIEGDDIQGGRALSATFSRARFEGDASFSRVTFVRSLLTLEDNSRPRRQWVSADFNSVIFSGSANFDQVVFSAFADFHSAIFSKIADFNGAAFSSSAQFNSATFAGDASFPLAVFSAPAWFQSALFKESADFWSAKFTSVIFDSATFRHQARFVSAIFAGSANFWNCLFLGGADFSLGPADRYGVPKDGSRSGVLRREAGPYSQFPEVDRGRAQPQFRGRRLLKSGPDARKEQLADPQVTHVVVHDIDPRVQLGLELAPQAEWRQRAVFRSVDFEYAEFWYDVIFEDRLFTQGTRFNGAGFFQIPMFYGAELHANTDFAGALFRPPFGVESPNQEHRKRFDSLCKSLDEEIKRAERRAELWSVTDGSKEYVNRFRARLERARQVEQKRKTLIDDANKQYQKNRRELVKDNDEPRNYERAFRYLKNFSEANRARNDENFFFTLELKSRIKRVRDREVSRWERWAAWWYGFLADFGSSIGRPLRRLIELGVLFTGVFALLSQFAGQGFDYLHAARYVGRNILPIFLLRDQIPAEGSQYDAWLQAVMVGEPFWFPVWSTAYTLMNLVLWFLFALALRRKFQIN